MYLDDIGLVIKTTRKSSRITQETLASQLHMSRATLSGIEKGTINEIGIRKIFAICDALGLELSVQTKTARPTLQQLMKRNREEGGHD